MNLPDYIAQIGEKEFARKFGITERAAASYRFRARKPKPELAERIVNESPVTWEGIYASGGVPMTQIAPKQRTA